MPRVEAGDRVICAPELERADSLEILTREIDHRPGQLVERSRGHDRGHAGHLSENCYRGADFFQGQRVLGLTVPSTRGAANRCLVSTGDERGLGESAGKATRSRRWVRQEQQHAL